jgi:hypothetical protein
MGVGKHYRCFEAGPSSMDPLSCSEWHLFLIQCLQSHFPLCFPNKVAGTLLVGTWKIGPLAKSTRDNISAQPELFAVEIFHLGNTSGIARCKAARFSVVLGRNASKTIASEEGSVQGPLPMRLCPFLPTALHQYMTFRSLQYNISHCLVLLQQ